MADFRVGWWCVLKSADGSRRCLHFHDRGHYNASCRVDANGRQFLLWQDEGGPASPGRPGRWESRFEFMPNAPAGDWWDNPTTSAATPRNPGNHSRNARQPTVRELGQRAATTDASTASGLCCEKEIHVGIFFDGTNNNKDRDRPDKGHSNVVTLFDAHEVDLTEKFRYYIPGVGTRFAEIGEEAESNASGNSFAVGGEARIHFGMLQVFDAVCRAAAGHDLLTAAETKQLVTTTDGLHTVWRLGDSKMVRIFRELDARLRTAIEGKRPKITKVNVTVIGFSRGAAQSRTFVKWLQMATGGTIGGAVCVLRFLGVFDTVASVALADSSPVGSGFMDWADGTMDIVGVERTAHFVAAHEIRRSFPLSTARSGGAWPSGVREFVFPGAHSDVGGGYSPGDQGKAMAGRTALLAQIPLNDMYHEALNAGVKVKIKEKLAAEVMADLRVDPVLDRAFMDYASWTIQYDEKQDVASVGGAPEDRMHYHTRLYWRWRAHVSADASFKAMSSYTNASTQDRIDLWEAELDWRRDVAAAREASVPQYDYVATPVGAVRSATPRSHASDVQCAILEQVGQATDVPSAVSDFFDRFVHDSHAGFWLLGPRTRLDKLALINEIKDKKRLHDYYAKLAGDVQNPGAARNYRNAARYYELNQFEQRVLAADAVTPGSVPVFSDADASELRHYAGTGTALAMRVMGTATRREASGHGRYRRIFDRS